MNNIQLNLAQTDFTGGDLIEGSVAVHIENPIPYRGVRVRFRGREKSYWSTGTGKHRRTHSETRIWFDEEITLSGRPRLPLTELLSDSLSGLFSKGNYEVLPQGDYETPFSYQLPEGLPGDYQSPGSSSITYTVTAEVDLPLKMDLKDEKQITIYERRPPSSAGPVVAQAAKSFLLESGSSLEASAQLQKDQVLPGESFPVRLQVSNHSQKTVEGVEIRLQQVEHLRAGGSRATREYEAARANFDAARVYPGQNQELLLPFTLPEDLYPSVLNSSLVRVEYVLLVKLVVPWAVDLSVRAPIVISEQPGRPGRKT